MFLQPNLKVLFKFKKITTKTEGFFEKLKLNNTSHDMNKIQCGFSHLLYVTYLVNPIGSIEGMVNYNLSKWLATCNGDNLEMNECDFYFDFHNNFWYFFIFTCDKNNTWSYILNNEPCEGIET